MSGRPRVHRAALIAALLVSGATLSPAGAQSPSAAQSPAGLPSYATFQDASTGTLPGGVTYAVRPDPSQSAAAIALWYRAPSSGFDATPLPGLSRLSAATVAASTPITGTPLGKLVERYGGRISVAAYPDSLAITAVVPPDRVAQAVRAMTTAYFAPVVDVGGLQVAQRDVAEDSLLRSYEPTDAIEDALGAALFAAGPFHDGTIAAPRSLGPVTLDQVRSYAERAFRPANAVLVLTGNVDPSVIQRVATREGAKATPESAGPQTVRTISAPLSRQGNVEGTGYGWAGPGITDETSATALDFLADALFAPKTGIVQRAIGTKHATVTGKFVTYHDPGVFLVTISGADADAVRPVVQHAIADAAKPMDGAAFRAARAGFIYRLLSQMETPAELADTYGWYTVEGAPAYAPAEGGARGRYFTIVQGLTPAAVARVAARYLAVPPAVVTFAKAKATGQGRS